MVAKLVVAKGKTAVKEIPLSADETIVGRRNDCTLRIPSPLVSRQHCTLNLRGERLLVKDLGSSNGTFVNGSKVKQRELRSGDTLGIGPVTFIVQLGSTAVSPGDTARPGGLAVADADDAADFVVEPEADDAVVADVVDDPSQVADEAAFVVEEQPAEVDAEEVADAVAEEVAEAVAANVSGDDDELSFVVADDATDAGGDDAGFVVAEEVADPATVHEGSVAEIDENDAPTNLAEPDTEIFYDTDDAASPQTAAVPAEKPAEPKKKGGLFGKLFKKKEKVAKKPAEKAAPTPPSPPPSKGASQKPPAAPADATPAAAADDEVTAEFVVQDDGETTGTAKSVGDEELADFLMDLNKKDE